MDPLSRRCSAFSITAKAHPLRTTPRDSGLCCLASRGLAVTLIKEAAPNKHSGRQMR